MRALETPRLALEPLRVSHAAEMFDLLADPVLYQFLPLDPPASLAALTERYRRLARGFSPSDDEVWLNWIVRDRATGAALGYVQATIYEDLTCEIGFLFDAATPSVLAIEACGAAVEELWSAHHVIRIEFLLDDRNADAAAVAEELGFQVAGMEDARDYHTGKPTREVSLVLDRPARAK